MGVAARCEWHESGHKTDIFGGYSRLVSWGQYPACRHSYQVDIACFCLLLNI